MLHPPGTEHDPNCSLARSLVQVGERWSLLIVREAIMGSSRFDEFHHRLGIARNILRDRLISLVRAGVLTRGFAQGNARIPQYALTQKGWELFPVIAALMQWGDVWLDEGKGAPIVLLHPDSKQPLRRLELQTQDGERVEPQSVVMKPGRGATERTRQRLLLIAKKIV